MLIVIVGNSCSGKTTLREELAKLGYVTIEASDYFRKAKKFWTTQSNLPLNIWGMELLLKEKGALLDNAIITGIRTNEEVEYLKNHFELIVIALLTNEEKSYERAIIRSREQIGSFKEFLDNVIRVDEEIGLRDLISNADKYIQNNENNLLEFVSRSIKVIEPYIVNISKITESSLGHSRVGENGINSSTA